MKLRTLTRLALVASLGFAQGLQAADAYVEDDFIAGTPQKEAPASPDRVASPLNHCHQCCKNHTPDTPSMTARIRALFTTDTGCADCNEKRPSREEMAAIHHKLARTREAQQASPLSRKHTKSHLTRFKSRLAEPANAEVAALKNKIATLKKQCSDDKKALEAAKKALVRARKATATNE